MSSKYVMPKPDGPYDEQGRYYIEYPDGMAPWQQPKSPRELEVEKRVQDAEDVRNGIFAVVFGFIMICWVLIMAVLRV